MRNGDSHIPALVVAYLVTRRSLSVDDAAYQLPAVGVLPIVAGPVKAGIRAYPTLEVWCPSFEGTHREIMVFDLMLDLHCSPSSTQSDENDWLAKIRRSFTGTLFQTYLGTLSNDDKSGWDLRNFVLTGGQTLVDGAERRVIRRTTARCQYRSDEFTD